MTREYYYAVRIGRPKSHFPYFMVRDARDKDCWQTPWLFATKEAAQDNCPNQPYTEVVRVCVSHGRPKRKAKR